jgi:2-hydroxychromene-2-carboxylate isomerase
MIKATLMRTITTLMTSPKLRQTARKTRAMVRQLKGARPVVHYFHEAADPYSHLTAQALGQFAARYDVELSCHLVPAPIEAAAPEREKLAGWGLRDAALLASVNGLDLPAAASLPLEEMTDLANRALTASLEGGTFLSDAVKIGAALWSGDTAALSSLPLATPETAKTQQDQGQALRLSLGHYLGATFQFEGEWYWGIDRLHFLESRLNQQGLDRTGGAPNYPAHEITLGAVPKSKTAKPQPVLHAFISFRSPYSYICLPRAKALADHYGAELRLRFIMPMVMRGLPVPRAKQYYITMDTKREAERVGLRYGTMVDPVGLGVERGLAVLHHAITKGHGYDFALSFTQGAFADGIDATTEAGLAQMAKRAGVSDATVKAALADESWRTTAEANREEMFAGGLWGVPSFRVNEGEARWGQDRLWAIEQDLIAAL